MIVSSFSRRFWRLSCRSSNSLRRCLFMFFSWWEVVVGVRVLFMDNFDDYIDLVLVSGRHIIVGWNSIVSVEYGGVKGEPVRISLMNGLVFELKSDQWDLLMLRIDKGYLE